MKKEKNIISRTEIKKVIRRVDKTNHMDFETFEEILYSEGYNIDLVHQIIDCLEMDYGFSCDSDLQDISDDEIDTLLEWVC